MGNFICNGLECGVRVYILCMGLIKWEYLEMKIVVNVFIYFWNILNVCVRGRVILVLFNSFNVIIFIYCGINRYRFFFLSFLGYYLGRVLGVLFVI